MIHRQSECRPRSESKWIETEGCFIRRIIAVTSICLFLIPSRLLADTDPERKETPRRGIALDVLELPFKTSEGVITSFYNLKTIVITPTRTAEKAGAIGGAVTVFTKEELDARGITTVKDALAKDYSTDVVQNGANGGLTSVFLRGADSGHTRVMIDGVRVFDPTSPSGAYDLAFLNLDNVRQVEVVKGPQSSLYGSDAIGGVVNIITNQGAGKPRWSVYGEGGSFYTYKGGAALAGQSGPWHFALGGSHLRTKGISKATRKLGNYETDPYENQSYSARVDYDIGQMLDIGYIGRYSYADYSYDQSFSPLDDPNLKAWSRQLVSSVVLNHKTLENLDQRVQLSMTGNDRRDFNEADAAHNPDYLRDWYYGSTQQVDWTASYRLRDVNTFVAGVNYLKERGAYYRYSNDAFGASESVFSKRYASTTGYFLEYRFNWNDRLTTTLNYRIERHSTFGRDDTYKIDALYRLDRVHTKLKAGYGTGFKAPTLYQLYALPEPSVFGGGNTKLKPEESKTYEVGLEQPFLSDALSAGVTYFHNDFTNLIDAVYQGPPSFFTDQYKNVSAAQSRGFEVPFRAELSRRFQVGGNYSRLFTLNKDTHTSLLRRARSKWNADFNWAPADKTNVNVDFSYVGHRRDSGTVTLKPYILINLKLSYRLHPDYNIYLRVENLFNEKYAVAQNYGTPGISAYSGVEIKF